MVSWDCLFSFLLNKVTNLPDFLNVAYAVSYSFSGWALANQTNVIWSDVLIELPILVWSIILLFKKKTVLYPIILAISLLDNFYMGYMLCIFSVLIFLSLLFLNSKLQKKLHYTGLFIGYSLLGRWLISFSFTCYYLYFILKRNLKFNLARIPISNLVQLSFFIFI